MENIYEPDQTFQFEQLQFISPTAIPGGNYFIRCLTGKQKQLYIQPPKCYCKSGVIKTGKRMYIDLVFKHDDEQFIEWVENLENLCQTKIFDNREKWFESGLEMHDIENSFTSAMKIYKSGKLYIIRANIPVRLGKCGLKIYDEQENEVDSATVNDKMQLMTILEIQGIKCSSRSFQLELEVKQMMTLDSTDLFESCLFSKAKPLNVDTPNVIVETVESDTDVDPNSNSNLDPNAEESDNMMKEMVVNDLVISDSEPLVTLEAEPFVKETLEAEPLVTETLESETFESEPLETLEDIPSKEIKIDTSENSNNGLCEIDFSLDESSGEVMQLKNRNDVYFEMYQNAKRKAKIARDIALSSYLEAKQIKNTYLLNDDIEDEEDDEKNESELKNIEKTIEES